MFQGRKNVSFREGINITTLGGSEFAFFWIHEKLLQCDTSAVRGSDHCPIRLQLSEPKDDGIAKVGEIKTGVMER